MQIALHREWFVTNLNGVRGCFEVEFSLPEIPTDFPKRPEWPYETAGIPAQYSGSGTGITVNAVVTHVATGYTYIRPCFWKVPSGTDPHYGKKGIWCLRVSPRYADEWTYQIYGQSSEFPIAELADELVADLPPSGGGGGATVGTWTGTGTFTVPTTRIHPGPWGMGYAGHPNPARQDERYWYAEEDDSPLLPLPGVNGNYVDGILESKWDGRVSLDRWWLMGDQSVNAPFDIGGQGGPSNFSNEYRPYVAGGDGVTPEVGVSIPAFRSTGAGDRLLVDTVRYEYANGTTRRFRANITVKLNSAVQDLGTLPFGIGLSYADWIPPAFIINPNVADTPVGTWVTLQADFNLPAVAQLGYYGFPHRLWLFLWNCKAGSSGEMLRCSLREIDASGNYLSGEICTDEWVSTDMRPSSWRSKNVDDIIFSLTERRRAMRFLAYSRQSGLNSFRLASGLLDVARILSWASYQESIAYDTSGGTPATNWKVMNFRYNARYMEARWGWSAAIASWELTNEGNADEPKYYEMAQKMGEFYQEFQTEPDKEVGMMTSSFHSISNYVNNPAHDTLTQTDWHANIYQYPGGEDIQGTPGGSHPYADIPSGGGYQVYYPDTANGTLYYDAAEGTVTVFDNSVVGSGAERAAVFYYSRNFGLAMPPGRRLALHFRYMVENGGTPPTAGNMYPFVVVKGSPTAPGLANNRVANHPWGLNDAGEPRRYLTVDPNLSDGLWHEFTWTHGHLETPAGCVGGICDIFMEFSIAAKLHIGRIWFEDLDTGEEIDVHRHDAATKEFFLVGLSTPPNDLRHFADEMAAIFGVDRTARSQAPGKIPTLGEYNPFYYFTDSDTNGTDPYLELELFPVILEGTVYSLIWQPTWLDNKIAVWGPKFDALKALLLRPEMKWGYGGWKTLRHTWDGTKVKVHGQVNATERRAILMVSPIAFTGLNLKNAREAAVAAAQDPFGDTVGAVAPVTGTVPLALPDGDYFVARRRQRDCTLIEAPATVTAVGGILDMPYTDLDVHEIFEVYEASPASMRGSAQGASLTTGRLVNSTSTCGIEQGGCKFITTMDPCSIPVNTWRVYKGGVLVAEGTFISHPSARTGAEHHWTVSHVVRVDKENTLLDVPTHDLDGVFVMPPVGAPIGDDYEVWWYDDANPIGDEGRRGPFMVKAGVGNPKVMPGVLRFFPIDGQVLLGVPFVNTWWIEDSVGAVVVFNILFGPVDWSSEDAFVGVSHDAVVWPDQDVGTAEGLVWKCFRGYPPGSPVPYAGYGYATFDVIAYDAAPDCMGDVEPPPPPDTEEMWEERCIVEATMDPRCVSGVLMTERVPGLRDAST